MRTNELPLAWDATDGRPEPIRWYALSTRARHEKQVELRLRRRSFEAYLPLVPRVREWHDRKRTVEWPLFPGYLFARFPAMSAPWIASTPGVAAVIRCNGAPAPVPDEEIENVRRFAAAVARLGEVPAPTPLIERGQRVRITSGALANVQGIVVERRGRGRAIVQIGLRVVGQGIKMDVDARCLRVVDAELRTAP